MENRNTAVPSIVKRICSHLKPGFLVITTYVHEGAKSGAGVVIRIYGSAEPEPKKIFTALQQHCLEYSAAGDLAASV
jgi:hypothetical protein